MAFNWVETKSKVPPLTSGMLVIESDDGRLGDYYNWFPLLKRVSRDYSPFYPYNLAHFVPNVNTHDLSRRPDRMTWDQVVEISAYGYEVISHGRHHSGLGAHPVAEPILTGQTVIRLMAPGQIRTEANYTYLLYEGDLSEVVRPIAVDEATSHTQAGDVALAEPTKNSYTTNALMRLTDDSMTDMMQGAIDDLAEHGIDTKHFVYPYHAGSDHMPNPHAISFASTIYESARGRQNTINVPGDPLNPLRCRLNTSLDESAIDSYLDQVRRDDSVMIVYGHGETAPRLLELLEYLVRGAIERGVRIATRSEAVDHLMV